jgi:hypothetical protein
MSEQDNENAIRHEVVFWRSRRGGRVMFGVEWESTDRDPEGLIGSLRHHLYARQRLRALDDLRAEDLL